MSSYPASACCYLISLLVGCSADGVVSCGCRDTKTAGMSCSGNGTAEIASGVDYSLGSPWVTVSSSAATFDFKDDGSSKVLLSKTLTPAAVRATNPHLVPLLGCLLISVCGLGRIAGAARLDEHADRLAVRQRRHRHPRNRLAGRARRRHLPPVTRGLAPRKRC